MDRQDERPELRARNDKELKTVSVAFANGISQLGADMSDLKEDVKGIKTDLKDWQGWLRLVSGAIIFTVGTSLGILLGVFISIDVALW